MLLVCVDGLKKLGFDVSKDGNGDGYGGGSRNVSVR